MMADAEPMQRDEVAHSDRPADGSEVFPDAQSVESLRRSSSQATLGLGIYTVVAIGLLGWSLLRGRLSDALLLLVAMAVTLPPIVSYRKQVRKRLRTLVGGDGPDAASTAASAEAGVPQAENASDRPATDSPSSPSRA